MNVAVVTTSNDPSAVLFRDGMPNGSNTKIVFYDSLLDDITSLDDYDNIILRDPYNTGNDYSFILQKILHTYPTKILLDYRCYKDMPKYEDKLFQSKIYEKNNLPHPKTIHTSDLGRLRDFPYLMKKRYSSRNKGNFIVNNQIDIQQYLSSGQLADYIFQKLLSIKSEYRILVYNRELVGFIEKTIIDNKLRVAAPKTDPKPEYIQIAIQAASAMLCEFAGVDLVITQDNTPLIIETNVSPQFLRYYEITNQNPVKTIFQSKGVS